LATGLYVLANHHANLQVFIVTGSSGGVGEELAQILYAADAKVYVAARSKPTAEKVMEEIKAAFPSSKGKLVYLYLDLSDLTTIKPAAQEFLSRESRLDVPLEQRRGHEHAARVDDEARLRAAAGHE
jgi:retinol dehydrogenase 12